MNNKGNSSLIGILLAVFILFILVISRTSTDSEWNDGVCPTCDSHYELQSSVKGWHHYIYPECYDEVTRYNPFPF